MALFVDIEKKLGSFHLQVKFEAGRDMLAILGASGCGKSMTLKCIAGIETPDRGRIVLDDTVLFDSEKHINLKPQKRMVGYLFQQYALFPNMTALENVMCGVRTGTKAEKRKKAAEIFDRLHLSGCEEKKPSMLSGGQQQRCALARILVNEPRVLLLDEPFSALDAHLRFHTERQVDGILKEFGITTILVSHDRDEVFRLTDHIAVMENGKIHAMGEKHAVFHEPETIEGAILTGCKNISRAEICSRTETSGRAETSDRADTSCRVEATDRANTGNRDEATGRIEARSAGKVYATDWGIELSVGEIPDDIRGVGIRMHDVLICEEDISTEKVPMSETEMQGATTEERDNVFRCHVIGEIENPFSYSVMLRPETEVSQMSVKNGFGTDVSGSFMPHPEIDTPQMLEDHDRETDVAGSVVLHQKFEVSQMSAEHGAGTNKFGHQQRKAARRENDRYILIDLPKARWNAIRTDVLTVRIPAERILLLK